MTTFAIALVTAALQVTLVAVLAMAVIALVGRRSPRTGANLAAAALLACALLLVVAITPLPHWWTWDAPTGSVAGPLVAEADHLVSPSTSDAGGWRVPFSRLTALLSVNTPSPVGPKPRRLLWPIVGGVFVAGVAIEVIRLLVGLWAVASIRRRSVLVTAPELIAQVDELRAEFGVTGTVAVCQSAAVGTAATIGWRRPVILLAVDWPTWDSVERRAVLAHELAHVRRRDYLTNLLAAICRAAHFYHPLVRWLAARLRLHQELAADSFAAAAAGGRAAYLQALARMALRQDAAVVAGMARPFLSDRTSLIRRITMLRVTDDGRPLSWATRWGLAAMLGLAAFAASALRGPAQTPATGNPSGSPPSNEFPPFDLSYIPPSAAGFMAIRPAALLSRPEMKPVAEEWQRLFRIACKSAGLGTAFAIPFDSIEQVVGPFEIKTLSAEQRKKNPHGEGHELLMGLTMIRMTHDFDWAATLKALAPLAAVTETKPGEFECRNPVFGRQPLTARVIDRRTVVFSLPEGGAVKRPDQITGKWGAAWKAVEGALLVEALDNADGRWTESLGHDPDIAPALAALGRPAHLALGLYGGESVSGKFAADYAEEMTDADVTRNAEALRRILRERLGANSKTAATDEKALYGLADELFRSYTIRRSGKLVTAEARSATKWVELLRAVTPRPGGGLEPTIEARESKP